MRIEETRHLRRERVGHTIARTFIFTSPATTIARQLRRAAAPRGRIDKVKMR
jgi:hypothetical protein